MCDETKFSVMCSLFNWVQRSKSPAKKRSKFRKFLDNFCGGPNGDYFGAMRLVLSGLDRERGSYGLKESVLATCLIDALGISRDSEDAIRLINWRKGGTAKAGANVGNFALLASEVLQRRQGSTSGGLTIKELNVLLDRLASSENRQEKINILADLIKRTNAQEMKWIIMIILKDLKLGVSEKSIFHEFHPDAEDLFNVTCDLKLVCEKLRDRSQRHKRQDIEVGKAVRPQLAMRVGNASIAWKKLHGKEVVVECKFDGDRIQLHKKGNEIHFFSRNFIDHVEYEHAISNIIIKNILVDRCILDGEMLVWDSSLNRFAEFGSNQEIAKAARDGFESDRQLCYVAFDVLYVGDTSVIHQSLKERHELLRQVVKPVKGRLEILVPNGGLNDHRVAGDPCWSTIAHNVEDVEKYFKETIENRDEGIVLKDLGSKWEPGDRSGKWLKLKPDYIRAGSDLDVLIIGGYYGSGRHGGEVAQFLVGLADRSSPDTHPRRFLSFCRVGTGLSDEELDAVATKLKPYFRKSEYPKKAPPSFYNVTNNSKERPDVWVENPEKSIILSITSDIRTIRSEVFAAPYSLRFPRIDKVRYDKPWYECLDVQSFIELVNSSNGTTQRDSKSGNGQDDKPKSIKRPGKGDRKKKLSVVPAHFIQTDISEIQGNISIFKNMVFYFVNTSQKHTLDSLHKLVAEHGGTFSMNSNNSVTHYIAAESKGIKFQAAKSQGDVIHCSWIFDCCEQKKLLPLQPKYFLFLSESSRKKLQEEIDEFSDPYYVDLDIKDLKQILGNVKVLEDSKAIDYYKKKFCPKEKWCWFHGCSIYFHVPEDTLDLDTKLLMSLSLRRLKLEVSMSGGKVCNKLSEATHLVITCPVELHVDCSALLKSLPSAEAHLVHRKGLYIVGSQWLDSCIDNEQKLPEDSFSLKPAGFEELEFSERAEDQKFSYTKQHKEQKESINASISRENPKNSNETVKRKRGRPPSTSAPKPKPSLILPRRTLLRRGNKSAKLSIPDDSSSEENTNKDESRIQEEDPKSNPSLIITQPQRTLRQHGKKASHLYEDISIKEEEPNMETENEQDQHQKAFLIESSQTKRSSPTRGLEVGGGNRIDVDETVADPVQAMLLDMIPSLGTQKSENTSSSTVQQPKSENASSSTVQQPIEDDNFEQPAKKKKVSYKDIAGDLLRDW
ncbi:DNA ligase 4 [Impatiens glandulifera]|uniref:DNA ligase 4 n=1 Tax=Impatiens glandulifera TaxID=253017 RepID=UPI001FB1757F|nr:DNA ligase 4 [Impatiens glandulifera]